MPRPQRTRPDFGVRDRGPGTALTRGQAVVGTLLVVAALLGVGLAAVLVTPRSAQRPELVTGSVILEDERPPVVVDLATGRPSIRLKEVYAQVDAASYGDVQVVELDAGSLLVNRRSGVFNFLSRGHLAVKREAGGVGLGDAADVVSAEAVPAGNGAYILQRTATGTRVSLVGRETVEAAAEIAQQGGGTVRPRGFAELDGVVLDRPGAAVAHAGELWVLVGSGEDGDDLEVVHLAPDEDGERALEVTPAGRVGAPAALTRARADEAAPPVVVSADGARVLAAEADARDAGDRALPLGGEAPTAVLPVASDAGPARFLVESEAGWRVVAVDADAGRVDTTTVQDLEPGTRLTAGAAAAGRLYAYGATEGDDRPALLQIDLGSGSASPVEGMARYPRKADSEVAEFDRAAVIARRGRVVFNNPASVLAVMVFADGGDEPVVVDKSTATDVSTTGAVGAPGDSGEVPEGPIPAADPAASAPEAAAPTVSEEARCAEADQQPRVPVLRQPEMSVRSATVSWTYPLLDTADCHPSSFSISIRALEGRQPATGFVEVTGQSAAVVEGLRPDTAYEFVVTAYLGERSTPSLPRTGVTLPTGPDAPTAVRVAADGRGQWVVSWDACSGDACDVPTGEWVVTGSGCGDGFVGAPPTVRTDGTSRQATIDAAGLGLLGKRLTFRVHGVGYDGLQGDPAGSPDCVEAWRPPLASQIALQASAAPAGGDTVTATLALTTAGPEIEAFGSRDVTFTYDVDGRQVGPTRERTVTVPGLEPGRSYRSQVTVTPVAHPEARVVVPGPTFAQTLPWPSMSMSATVEEQLLDPNRGTLVARFRGRPMLDMDVVGTFTCGSYLQPVSAQIPAFGDSFSMDLDLVRAGGSCALDVRLRERSTRRYGTDSPPLAASVTAGQQVDPRPFRARWQTLPTREGRVEVTLDSGGKGADWVVRLVPQCPVEERLGSPPSPIAPVVLDARDCIADPANRGATFAVEVSWRYLGSVQQVTVPISGNQPDPPATTTTTTEASTTSSRPTSTTGAPTTTTATNGPAALPPAPTLAGLVALVALVEARRRRLSRGAR